MDTPQLLADKVALVCGVANKRSIAWAVAKKFSDAGAHVIITYQDDRLASNIFPLAEELPKCTTVQCDLTQADQLTTAFEKISSLVPGIDAVVHSVAYALREDLDGRFVDTSSEGFQIAQNVSAYTLVSLSKAALPLMEKRGGGSILAMTYLGSERVIPNYNVMGVAKASLEACVRYLAADLGPMNIRVNALSPGPINTLAARGITGFMTMLPIIRERSPLRRITELEEVADTALFFASDMARGITGELVHIDSGYHITGL